ncbi:PREDICTED: larval cuticle protein 9 [Drosophila arizonae]|uniref:Larval cuticle protein 9 n=1 Tax=Drosophila arizonae TaxID=7263 RepID=A0ABM1PGR9_DROAR|nr:PREDICTED: larval cuticle protein 9 [Drosophila arizonae]
MKFVIVFACFLALAFADVPVTVKEYNEVNPDSFKYEWATSDGSNVQQDGVLKDPHTILVKGSYEYVSREGKVIKVTYTADENGYKPVIIQQ